MYLRIEKNIIEDWYILPEVCQAKEIKYDAHIKHGYHLKVEPTYNKILRAGYRWDNMLIDIRDLYFKWQVWDIRTSKPRKNAIAKHIKSYKSKERYLGEHSTTKVAPFRVMMNIENKDLIHKIRENIIKKR